MISKKTVDEIKHSPLNERLQIIELVIQSLKQDMQISVKQKSGKFKVRQFHLGDDVQVDRDELYKDRGI